MGQSETAAAIQSMEPATDISAGSKSGSRNPNISAVASGPSHDPRADGAGATYPNPPAYFDEALQDAERLLKYAAEIGIDINADTRDHILQARAASSVAWNEEITANLLGALTKVAAQLKPVTAESLKDNSQHTVRVYWWVAVCLAIVIVPFSIVSFITSAISTTIRTDITSANDLAVKLRAQLGAPADLSPTAASGTANAANPAAPVPVGLNEADVITELQQYASTIRAIDARSRQLNALVFHAQWDQYAAIRSNPQSIHAVFELPRGLLNLPQTAEDKTQLYQYVRYFAQSVLDDVSVYYGAITTCLLPVLYALLGTCAYLLRSFEKQMALRTFTPSAANSARFLIAAIGGAVVGLFNNFTVTEGASIPPLAIAFLVGYAVDVFFAFLEGFLQTFTKTATNSPAPTPASGG
jgi:hypothetical protein